MRLLFGLYVILIAVLSLTPSDDTTQWPYDKVAHFGAYLIMALFGLIAFRSRNARLGVLLFIIALGMLLEWGQSFIDGRQMSIADGVANMLGVICGGLLFALVGDKVSERLRIRG